MKFILLLLCAFTANFFSLSELIIAESQVSSGDIIVFVDNVIQDKGEVYVGLFDSKKTFRKIKKVYKFTKSQATNDEMVLTLEDVPFNEYAVVVFQDFNGNVKMDKNFIGIPKEPFGFSTNYKVTTKAPKFHEVTFSHHDEDTEISIALQRM